MSGHVSLQHLYCVYPHTPKKPISSQIYQKNPACVKSVIILNITIPTKEGYQTKLTGHYWDICKGWRWGRGVQDEALRVGFSRFKVGFPAASLKCGSPAWA